MTFNLLSWLVCLSHRRLGQLGPSSIHPHFIDVVVWITISPLVFVSPCFISFFSVDCLACFSRHYGDAMIEVGMKWGFLEKIPSLATATVRRSTEISDNILILVSILSL